MKIAYKAINQEGKAVKGLLEAKDSREAAILLRSKGLIPTKIKAQNQSSLATYIPFLRKIKASDRIFFTRQLSSMLLSGLTLMQALTILRDQTQNPTMTEVINTIVADIEGGSTFSKALEKNPQVFPSLYVSLIKAGESSGLLDKVLLRLAENLEKEQKLRSTIKSALTYPSIVVILMLGVVVIMMTFLVPQLSSIYENIDVEIPLPTRIVVGASNFVKNFWFLLIGGVLLLLFVFRRWHKTSSGKLIVDDLLLKLPIFGKLIKESTLTEFTRTLGLLIGSGTLIVESLNQSADAVGNTLYKNAILDVSSRVEKGLTMGDALSSYPLFPNVLIQMVRVGEQTGKVDESLLRISEYFEREVEQTVKNLTTLMEPFIIIGLGIGVLFLMFSVFTPIYSLISQIQ